MPLASSGVGCDGGAGHVPRKKISFYPQNDKFRCILPQFLTGRQHESLGNGFHSSTAKLQSLQKQ